MKFIKQNITNKTLYTKHFYAESQRLASKLGAGLASSIVDPTQFQVTEVCSSYEEKSDSLLQMLERGRKIDDYFTKDGKYLGTDDAKTDNVRIIDESEWKKQSSVMGTMIIHDVGNDLSESPTDAEVSENAQMNIYNYYNPTDLTLLKDNSGDYNMTFRVEIIESIVNGNIVSTSSSAKEIGINVKRNYVSGYINNAADIKSLFEHEATHYNDFKSFPEKYLEIRETNNNRLELRAITNQLNQGYYKYCSDNFKKGIMTYSEEFGGILKKFNALPPTITN